MSQIVSVVSSGGKPGNVPSLVLYCKALIGPSHMKIAGPYKFHCLYIACHCESVISLPVYNM